MIEFLKIQIKPGMLIYSIPMLFVVLYWGLMVIGLLDLEFLDSLFGGADGVVDGGAEAIVDGAAEAAIDGAVDAAAESASEAIGEGVGEAISTVGEGGNALSTSLVFLNFGKAPAVLVLSILIFAMWFLGNIGYAATRDLARTTIFVSIVLWGVIFAICFVGAAIFTHFAAKPFAVLTAQYTRHSEHHLIGQVCHIRTSMVTDCLGQAEVRSDDSPILIHVVCERDNILKKGDQAVIVDFYPDLNKYVVEPFF